MLVSFRVKNFKSIVDATLDLRYGEGKAPNGYAEMDRLPFLEAGWDSLTARLYRGIPRVVPVFAIYGQNAGGKSTLLEALKTFLGLVCSYSLTSITEKLAFCPNVLHPELKTTEYSIEAAFQGKFFRYTILHTSEAILREELWKGNKQLYLIDHENKIFEFEHIATVDYPAKRIRSILDVECIAADGNQRHALLTKIGMNYAGLNRSVALFFCEIHGTFVLSDNNITPDVALKLLQDLPYHKTPDDAFREIESYMTKLDMGIARIELSPEARDAMQASREHGLSYKGERSFESLSKSPAETIYTYHRRTDGDLVPLRLKDESRGSQVLFGLLGILLTTLHMGGTVVIDELDRSIHPLVLKSLVTLFTDKTYNKRGAQLVFTAHNTELLDGDDLRLSEVGIVTKTAAQGTQLRRLCEYEGVRNVKNFRLGYLDGYFSGIPFPSI